MLVKKLGKPDHEPYRIWDTISQSIGSCLVLQQKKNPNQLPTFRGQFQILNKLSIQQPAVSFSVSIRFCDQLIWKNGQNNTRSTPRVPNSQAPPAGDPKPVFFCEFDAAVSDFTSPKAKKNATQVYK
jgi:hypothetical protein